jgi:hypothetical protein
MLEANHTKQFFSKPAADVAALQRITAWAMVSSNRAEQRHLWFLRIFNERLERRWMRTPPEFIAAEMEFYEISFEDCFGCGSRMLQRRFRDEPILKMKMRGETEFQQQF